MKKRIISLLLSLTMMTSMIPMLTITASAAAMHNPYHKDGNLCYMLPYAYNAMQFKSTDYYITHYNVEHIYNYANLASSFEQGIPQAIDDALSDPASTITAVVNEVITFDGEITEQDLYDYMLAYMLIEDATTPDPYQTDKINGILSIPDICVEIAGLKQYKTFGEWIKEIKTLQDAKKLIEGFKAAHGDTYEKIFGGWSLESVGNLLLALNAVCEIADEYNQFEKLVNDYYTLFYKLGGNGAAKTVLSEMWNNTDDICLKTSIRKFYDVVANNDAFSVALFEMIHSGIEMAGNVSSVMFRAELIQTALKAISNPSATALVAGLLAAYSVFDVFFAVGDFQESVFEIDLYDTIDSSILGAIKNLESYCVRDHEDKESVRYCEAYVLAMQMAWRLKTKELEKCKDFLSRGKEKKWFRDSSTVEDTIACIDANIKRVGTEIPNRFINSALDQYNYDRDLISAGYKITYDLNGGNGNVPNATKKYNDVYTLTEAIPTKDGYAFLGWQLSGDGYYCPGYELEATLNPCWCSKELVFTAYWTNQDIITYDANGGETIPYAHENTAGDTKLSDTWPSKTGHTFLGWAEEPEPDENAKLYAPGELFPTDGDVTLYAIWTPATFNIVFDANGGVYADGSETITLQKTYLQNFTVTPEIPTRAGYSFSGSWALNPDGSGIAYKQGETYKDIGGAGLETKRLYAVWLDTEAEVLYDYNDDPAGTAVTKSYDKVDLSAGAVNYTIKDASERDTFNGNRFKGWIYLDPNGTYWATNGAYDLGRYTLYQPGEQVSLTGDLTLYAKWTYLVHYDYGDQKYSHAEVNDNAAYTVQESIYSGDEATFKYWKCKNTGDIYQPGQQINLSSDLYLTAVWEGNDTTEYVMPGDVDGNSMVNNLDLLAFQKYLEGISGNVVEGALDTDGNNTVNQDDFTRLHQYLSGWDVVIYPVNTSEVSLFSAFPEMTVTQPKNNAWILYSDPPRLEWEAVDGAAGYRISIRNVGTDELLYELKWTTNTYYSLTNKLDAAAGKYRIWIGAMPSKTADASEALAASTLTIFTKPEPPEIEDETWEDRTYNSITLSMNITKNNGSAITDSGFYIVEDGLPTSEWVQYSFKEYGDYSATSEKYKEMTITGLQPETTYHCYAYAVNDEGETITDRFSVTTEEYLCPHTSGVYINEYPESITYVDTGDDTQHQEIWYFDEYCNYCRKVVTEAAQTEVYYKPHNFVADVCTLCKHALSCSHDTVTKVYYTTTYKIADETYHIRNAFYNPVCDQCGEVTDTKTLFDSYEEEHTFSDQICTGCGYALAENLSVTASVDRITANPGDVVAVDAKAIGGAGSYQFAYVILQNGELVDRMGYSNMTSWSYTVTEPGVYQFKVYCKDGEDTVAVVDSELIHVLSSDAMSLYGNHETVGAGETVDITFSVAHNIGWKSLKFNLEYDQTYLMVENIDFNSAILSEKDILWAPATDNPFVLNCFETESSSAVCSLDGSYVTMTFRVAENADAGYYPIRIDYDECDVFNANGQPLSVETTDAYIVVEDDTSSDTGTEDDSGVLGGYVFQLQNSTGASVTINADNKTDENVTAVLILAVYDGRGQMIACSMGEVLWYTNETIEMTAAYDKSENADYVKVFLLDPESMQPLRTEWQQVL